MVVSANVNDIISHAERVHKSFNSDVYNTHLNVYLNQISMFRVHVNRSAIGFNSIGLTKTGASKHTHYVCSHTGCVSVSNDHISLSPHPCDRIFWKTELIQY